MAIYPRDVYIITHNVTKKMYIGSSGIFDKRIKLHLNALRSGRHPIEDMQSDFDIYGEDYTIEILDRIDSVKEFRKEYDYMDLYKSRVRAIGYNYKDNHAIKKN